MKKLYVIGMGMGNEGLLTMEAKTSIEKAETILTTKRIANFSKNALVCGMEEMKTILANSESKNIAVLASGDVSFFSISDTITKHFSNAYEIRLINGISSMQYLSAQLQISYGDAKVVSMHGREAQLISTVTYHKKVFVLTDQIHTVNKICEWLCQCGLEQVRVSVGENLSYPNERIVTAKAGELLEYHFSDLTAMFIENESAIRPRTGICDAEFIRGQVPMTKEEIRAIVIAKLNIQPSDILYDIGAGSGSVAIEMARHAYDGMIYAIEKEDKAIDLIRRNRIKHKAYNVQLVQATAPEGMESLPSPDAVFIGGSAGNLKEIIHAVLQKNENARIVMTAITLETLSMAMQIFDFQVICVNISKAEKVSSYNMMKAENPVYILSMKDNRS